MVTYTLLTTLAIKKFSIIEVTYALMVLGSQLTVGVAYYSSERITYTLYYRDC